MIVVRVFNSALLLNLGRVGQIDRVASTQAALLPSSPSNPKPVRGAPFFPMSALSKSVRFAPALLFALEISRQNERFLLNSRPFGVILA